MEIARRLASEALRMLLGSQDAIRFPEPCIMSFNDFLLQNIH